MRYADHPKCVDTTIILDCSVHGMYVSVCKGIDVRMCFAR